MMDLDMQSVIATFLVEGRELALQLEDGLLRIEQGHDPHDPELINAMFRAAHTIKGSAGIVGIDSLTRFTHNVENLLDRVREGEPLLDSAMITRLLRCCDHINALLDRAEQGDALALSLQPRESELLQGLEAPQVVAAASDDLASWGSFAPPSPASDGFRMWAVFHVDALRYGMDPAGAVNYLAERVQLDHRCMILARVPGLDELDPEACLVALALSSEHGSDVQARNAFDFFEDDSALVILAMDAPRQVVQQALAPLRALLGEQAPQAWVDAGLLLPDEWSPAPSLAAPAPAAAQPLVSATVAEPVHAATRVAPSRFVRVPSERLDELIAQVGELVIAGAGVEVLARDTRLTRLNEAVGALKQLIDTIQSGTLQLRMVPIGETFSRFQRVVRDVSKELGKDIALDLVGSDTELDKAMVERIGDPLMHLVRNAMDHGLETPSARLAAGKPAQGTLRLRACHDSGNVVVEVSDDGRGLDRERILAKAIERGLVSHGDGLSDQDIYQLIFEPGFSTADAVTKLSGRGVGMDVVKKSVEALRGTISLYSQPGEGSCMQLRLPLTLAIIDGFMVSVGSTRFILPMDTVVECIELPADALRPGQPHYIHLRDEILSYICLRETFGIQGEPLRRPSLVVLRSGEVKTGVLVDALHGEIQTVIKPLTGIFRQVRALSGTSILGTGAIALVLDVNHLIQSTVERSARQATPFPLLGTPA
jgi:two-component system chemotaxis sensor kinase CheA